MTEERPVPSDTAPANKPVFEHFGVFERARYELQLGEGDVLVHALEDTVDVGSGLHELGGEPEGLGGRVRVLEPARVRDECDVKGLGELRRDRDADQPEDVAQVVIDLLQMPARSLPSRIELRPSKPQK